MGNRENLIFCVKCKHHRDGHPLHSPNECHYSAKIKMNYVTGNNYYRHVEDCGSNNSDGKCLDYEPRVTLKHKIITIILLVAIIFFIVIGIFLSVF